MEGPALLIFQDERFTEGSQWLRDGMHLLAPGDELTIYAPDGDVLWQGRLRWQRQGWFGPKTLILKEMLHWFDLSPPLRARLHPGST